MGKTESAGKPSTNFSGCDNGNTDKDSSAIKDMKIFGIHSEAIFRQLRANSRQTSSEDGYKWVCW